MTIGFAPQATTRGSSRLFRNLEPAEWTAAGIPLLANPREVVKDLQFRHLPTPVTAVVAVFAPEGRLVASASFTGSTGAVDGWEHRNAILAHLRRVLPHDLRRRTPARTAMLLLCRDGPPGWTEEDGAWMWGLRDACGLHGLRCGAYITLTREGWRVLGENRCGRTPNSGHLSERTGGVAAPGPHRAPESLRRTAAR
ncbi:hypothetical protein [Streptomyces sp. H39-S7]|uniref:hypothetical protein n=1 Tax=Streptomyces sp. H39-S7 TaxID=3004357 RepID=UPI0022AFC32C|nr:hypothetical protein [Streptomyces sp. H39-S7]MCZ4119342.1 hypothetical protein [Streptomyces sp. H39-S7]